MSDQLAASTTERLTRMLAGKDFPPGLGEQISIALKRIAILEANGQNFSLIDTIAQWLTIVAELPWYRQSDDNLSLEEARRILDAGHHGQEIIKERILEFISVQKLTQGNARGMVLCFVGPPGTGKTTIAKIIAEALGRKFERISLAALGDMSQLRGKSRFLPDADPSLIIKAIHHAGVKNPVICLDEIEKVGGEGLLGGEAMAAFLEILDPEQNNAFHDHYLDFPFDLSKVLFIATANKMLGADSPVIDRLEIISLPDYTRLDKIVIGKQFIVPQKFKEMGLADAGVKVTLTDDAWDRILSPYSWDSGMRTLQHTIGAIFYKVARQVVETGVKEYTVSAANLKDYVLV